MPTISTVSSGSGVLSVTVSPGRESLFEEARLHLNSASSTAENLTITLDSQEGSIHDVLMVSVDMDEVHDLQMIAPEESRFLSGDSWVVSWANTNSITWGLEVRYVV